MRKLMWLTGLAALLCIGTTTTRAQEVCVGDCNGDLMVVVNELITCVNIALGNTPLSNCPSCDANDDGEVVVNDLITAVNRALNGCDGEGYCGDNQVNVEGEECDDGNNVGGDGCAANCTEEIRRETTLDPNLSRSTVQLLSLRLPLMLSGTQALTGGSPRDTAVFGAGGVKLFDPMEVPIIIKAEDVRFNPIGLNGLGCACVRAVPVDEFGPGVSGIGRLSCSDTGLTDINFLVEQDHSTIPGAVGNSGPENGLPDDPECDDTFVAGEGAMYQACLEGEGAACSLDGNIHRNPPVCQSPRRLTFSGGPAGRGSVLLFNSTAIALLTNTGANPCAATLNNGVCSAPEFGEDCQPCTEDDPFKGIATIAPTTSGTASVRVYDANNIPGLRIGLGETCTGQPCLSEVTGIAADCDSLQDPEAGLSGALVTAFPGLDQELVGDAVITTVLQAQED